ncbi:MAG: metallophosphoesterase [Planctomycetota bacterium]
MRHLRSLLLVLLVATSARADSFVGLFEPDYASDAKVKQTKPFLSKRIRHLSYPVMGFPSLVEPAGTIPMRVLLPNGGKTGDFKATLVTAATATPASFALVPTGQQSYDPATGVYTVEVSVPKDVPPAVYDLELQSADFPAPTKDRQPNAVRVLDPARTAPQFAIIADTQTQDVTTQVPPQRLVEMLTEIRLRSPDFVIFVGDWNFGSDYTTEYEENWNIFATSGLAIFCVPGNHDGYATVIPLSPGPNPPGRVERDGLESWKKYVGPTLFSFDYLGQHFVGINSMGGTPERRNSVGILVTNYGGFVDQDHLDWIERDVAAATARGKKTVLFMHHNPASPAQGDQVAYPFPIPTFSGQDWNDAPSKTRLEDIIARYDVSHVLYGHIHHDHYDDVTIGNKVIPHVATTTMDCGALKNHGYRWMQTIGGRISEINYMGLKQQSVPFPALGLNLETTWSGPRDGTETTLSATIASRLIHPTTVIVELPVRRAGALIAKGGTLDSVVLSGTSSVALVRVDVPAGGQATVSVEPDPNVPNRTAPRSGGTAAPGSTRGAGTPLTNGGGGGGSGGCALGASPNTSSELVPLLLVLLVLLGRKACSHRHGG